MDITDEARSAARELTRVWTRKPRVHRHWDEAKRYSIDVATCEDTPVNGVTGVGTVGLSAHDFGPGRPRVEIIGAFVTTFSEGANMAATCAFNAIKDGYVVAPDVIHQGVLCHYLASPALPHILFVDPFLWDDGPNTLHVGGVAIAWVMMVPISESERLFAAENGPNALTVRFEQAQIDIFDLSRASVA
jgi:hypothetical protein